MHHFLETLSCGRLYCFISRGFGDILSYFHINIPSVPLMYKIHVSKYFFFLFCLHPTQVEGLNAEGIVSELNTKKEKKKLLDYISYIFILIAQVPMKTIKVISLCCRCGLDAWSL